MNLFNQNFMIFTFYIFAGDFSLNCMLQLYNPSFKIAFNGFAVIFCLAIIGYYLIYALYLIKTTRNFPKIFEEK